MELRYFTLAQDNLHKVVNYIRTNKILCKVKWLEYLSENRRLYFIVWICLWVIVQLKFKLFIGLLT